VFGNGHETCFCEENNIFQRFYLISFCGAATKSEVIEVQNSPLVRQSCGRVLF